MVRLLRRIKPVETQLEAQVERGSIVTAEAQATLGPEAETLIEYHELG